MDQRTMTVYRGAFIVSLALLLSAIVWLSLVSLSLTDTISPPVHAAEVINVQGTPTADPTMTELQKNQLRQQINQLELQNERSPSEWIWNNASALLSVIIVVGSAIFGLYRWTNERRTEREKASEERFQSVVEGLGGERVEMKVDGVIVLRNFLLPGYEKFYRQVFDLAVAHLRLQHHTFFENPQQIKSLEQTSSTPLISTNIHSWKQADLKKSEHPDPLSLALTIVFKESFPLIRDWLEEGGELPRLFSVEGILVRLRLKQRPSLYKPQLLDATAVQLDKAHLLRADLKKIWMPEANLRGADLKSAEFNEANLEGTDFSGAHLERADFTHATLTGAIFTGAFLDGAQFSRAHLVDTRFDQADLRGAQFDEAFFGSCIFTEANLTKTNFTRAKRLSQTNLSDARSLKEATIHDVELTNDQIEAYQRAEASVKVKTQARGLKPSSSTH